MRIWDLPVSRLCRKHLLGEHRELHAIWSILVNDRRGYRNHPEVKRWEGRLQHLAARHRAQVQEIEQRGWNHQSPLKDVPPWDPDMRPPHRIDSLRAQRERLRSKGCDCRITT